MIATIPALLAVVTEALPQDVSQAANAGAPAAHNSINYLKLLGKEVPTDLSLVSHEIAGGFEFLYPPITTFVQPSNWTKLESTRLPSRL